MHRSGIAKGSVTTTLWQNVGGTGSSRDAGEGG